MDTTQVIVVGGGLSGLSAAHTVLQAGGSVLLLDKMAFMGGNSTKATSGINGAGTAAQRAAGIKDSVDIFNEDTTRSATGVKDPKIPCPPKYALGTALTHGSPHAVQWLIDSFGLVLDTVSRLGGHSHPRTHRRGDGGKFPGMMITYALMTKYDDICKSNPERARLINRARVDKLISKDGRVVGCEYEVKGERFTAMGPVVVCTGGYAAGNLERGSLLERVRPELMRLPTTNGVHCTGDGIKFVQEAGGDAVDLDKVQVHPTGMVHPDAPDDKVKFLAAEALRGEGGLILDREGNRLANELGTRDYVSGRMFDHNKFPYYLVLNSKASSGIAWHCHHYCGRKVMKKYANARDFCQDKGIPLANVQKTFAAYNKMKPGDCPWGKKFFPATPFEIEEGYHVAQITPINHYTMGGIKINEHAEVIRTDGKVMQGAFCAGEATGGVHGRNRLGGSALLECVVYGRIAGATVSDYVGSGRCGPASLYAGGNTGGSSSDAKSGGSSSGENKVYTLEEVAKHNTDSDCWVVVGGKVLDVTNFLDDHPGGKMAIMTFAGKDATEMFDMVHEAGTLEKYAPETIIGTLAPSSKL